MTMTNEEILRDYRGAKNRVAQIGILADLNACKKQDIVEILQAAGEKVPGNFGKKKRPPQSAPPTREQGGTKRPASGKGLTVKTLIELLKRAPDPEAGVLADGSEIRTVAMTSVWHADTGECTWSVWLGLK